MNRPVRKYVEKLESVDFSAGTYHARKLPPRARYNRMDFYEYLYLMEAMQMEELFEIPPFEEDVG
jgi:hypothetical protein